MGEGVDQKEKTELNFNFAAELGFEARLTQKLSLNLGFHVFALDNPEFVKTEEDGETQITLEK